MTDSIKTITQAVSSVMLEVARIKKGDKNQHGRYEFTSTDDIKDHIRPLMAKNGLFPTIDQTGFEMMEYSSNSGKKTVAKFDFEIILGHATGFAIPERISVLLPFVGPQTTGIARSYAFKEWAKSRFLISTGDMQDEGDMVAPEEMRPKQNTKPEQTPVEKMDHLVAWLADCTEMEKFTKAEQRAKDELQPNLSKDDWLRLEPILTETYLRLSDNVDKDAA